MFSGILWGHAVMPCKQDKDILFLFLTICDGDTWESNHVLYIYDYPIKIKWTATSPEVAEGSKVHQNAFPETSCCFPSPFMLHRNW